MLLSVCVCVRDCFGTLPTRLLMFGADQREARRTPKHQPFLEWFSADPPVDARGRPTGGAPHSQTPTLLGMVFCRSTRGADQREARPTPKRQPVLGSFFAGPPADARGRPTGGAPHLQTPTLLRIAFLPT